MSSDDDDLADKSFGDGGDSDSSDGKKSSKEEKPKENNIKPNKEEDKKKDDQKDDKSQKESDSDDDSSSEEKKKEKVKKEEKKEEKKEAEKEDKKEDKKRDSSSDSSSKNKEKDNKEKKEKKDSKENQKRIEDLESDDEKKKKNKEDKSSDSNDSSDSDKKEKEKNKKKKEKDEKDKKEEDKKNEEKEKEEEKKKKEEEKKRKEEEKKRKEEEEKEKRRKQEEEKRRKQQEEDKNKNEYQRNNERYNNNNGNYSNFNNSGPRNNYYRDNNRNEHFGRQNFNQNSYSDGGSYQQKKPRKFDLNEKITLNKIIEENKEIINEMKSAYPGITRLECASVFKKIKSSNSQTIFEMMNQIHREICTIITLNEVDNRNQSSYMLPIDPYEIIDPLFNNPEHVKVMKYYKVYSEDDKDKLPRYVSDIFKKYPNYFYTNEYNRRRQLIKYPDGGFNYIPIKCENNCQKENCPYSHNDLEMEIHPLFYKTKYSSQAAKGSLDKMANNLKDDFRIIYNYKNQNIINLLKLLDEKKIAKSSFREIFKNKINSFELETFKTIECPSVKSGISCSKDPHLCYFYHTLSERRRPPSLFRYINEMCQEQKYSDSGKIKNRCENGDFCNLCHSRYEYYYHKLYFGKAMTCLRPKKNGRCIFEETCYAYHPYKEPGYKKTREEIIQEKKDELMDKYNEEYELLSGLISKYKCQNCNKFNKKFLYYYLVNCEHIICHKCYKEKAKKKCPICKEKYDAEKEGEEFVVMNIKESAKNIDELIKKNYEEKLLLKEKKEKSGEEDKKDKKEEEKKDDEKNKKDNKKNEKDSDKSDSDDEKDNNNNSMG